MPDPRRNFELIKADLEAVGFTVEPRAAPWNPDYLDAGSDRTAGQMYLLGWTGDFGDPDNFVGTFFQAGEAAVGSFTDAGASQGELDEAEAETDEAEREAATRRSTADHGLSCRRCPTSHTKPDIAFREGDRGLRAEPGQQRGLSHGHRSGLKPPERWRASSSGGCCC